MQVEDLANCGRSLGMVRSCEIGFARLWLLVLLPDELMTSEQGSKRKNPTESQFREIQVKKVWESIRALLAMFISSPLKVRALT